MLPSNMRKGIARKYLDEVIKKNDETLDGWRAVKDHKIIKKYYSFDDQELNREMYIMALENRRIKNLYATDKTIIKKEMKLIFELLIDKGLTKPQIAEFFYDVFYHFNFEICRHHDPGSYQKRVYMMVKRLKF